MDGTVSVSFLVFIITITTTTGFSGRIMNALIMTGPELEGHDRTAYSPFGQWGRPGQKRILRPHAAQILHLASLMAIVRLNYYIIFFFNNETTLSGSADCPTLINTKIILLVTTSSIKSQEHAL